MDQKTRTYAKILGVIVMIAITVWAVFAYEKKSNEIYSGEDQVDQSKDLKKIEIYQNSNELQKKQAIAKTNITASVGKKRDSGADSNVKKTSNKKVQNEKTSDSIKATIKKLSMKYDGKQVRFRFKVTNTGKIAFDENTKLRLSILRVKGQKICQDCKEMQTVLDYVEAKVFNSYLGGLNPKDSRDVEFAYGPEIFSRYEYFAEIVNGNGTISRTKNQHFKHNKQ